MEINEIMDEGDLRSWMKRNAKIALNVELQWIEPYKGSTIGAPDVVIKCNMSKVEIELKHLKVKKRGIQWKLRPAQRRYHHMAARNGHKTALLIATNYNNNFLVLVKNSNIPLRDYADDPDSGCYNGQISMYPIETFSALLEKLFVDDIFWSSNTHYHGGLNFGLRR